MTFIKAFLGFTPTSGGSAGASRAAQAGMAARAGLAQFLLVQIVITAIMMVAMYAIMEAFFLQDARTMVTQSMIQVHRTLDMEMEKQRNIKEIVDANELIPQDMCPLGYDKEYYTSTDRLYTKNSYYGSPAHSIYADGEGVCVCPAEMFENIQLNNSLVYFNNDYVVIQFENLKQYFNLNVVKPNIYLDAFNNLQENYYKYKVNHLRHDNQNKLIYFHKSEMKKILYYFIQRKIFEYNLTNNYQSDMIVSKSVINKFIFKDSYLVSELFDNEEPPENTNIYYNEYEAIEGGDDCQKEFVHDICLINSHHSIFFGKDPRYYYYPKHWMNLPDHFQKVKWRPVSWNKVESTNQYGETEELYQIPSNKLITISMNDIYKLKHLKIPADTTRVVDIPKNSKSIVSSFKSIRKTDLEAFDNLDFYDFNNDTLNLKEQDKISKHEKFIIDNKDQYNSRVFRIDAHITIHATLVNTEFYSNISKLIAHNYNDEGIDPRDGNYYVGTGWVLIRRLSPRYKKGKVWNPTNDNLALTSEYMYDNDGNEYIAKDIVEEHNIYNNKNSQFTFSRTTVDANLENFNQYLIATADDFITASGDRLPNKWMVFNKEEIFENNKPTVKHSEKINVIANNNNKFNPEDIRIFNGNSNYGGYFKPTKTSSGGEPKGAPEYGNNYVYSYQDFNTRNTNKFTGPIIFNKDHNLTFHGRGPNQTALNNNDNDVLYAEENLTDEKLDFIYNRYKGRERHTFFDLFGDKLHEWKYHYDYNRRYDFSSHHKINYYNNISQNGGINVYVRYNPKIDKSPSSFTPGMNSAMKAAFSNTKFPGF